MRTPSHRTWIRLAALVAGSCGFAAFVAPAPAAAEKPATTASKPAAPTAKPSAPAEKPAAEGSPERLMQLYYEGKLDELESECQAILAKNPADTRTRITLANAYRKRGVDASAGWERMTLASPSQLPGAASLERAVTELKTVLEAEPSRRDVWFGLCQIERERRNVEGLVSCTTSALERFPGDELLVSDLLANLRPVIERGDYVAAAAALEPLAAKAPKSREVQMTTGRALFLSGKTEAGIEVLSKLSEVLPEDAELQYQRGELTAFSGDWGQAGLLFARAAKLKARGGAAHLGVIGSAHVMDPVLATQLLRGTLNRWKNEKERTLDASIPVQAGMRKFDAILTAVPPSAQDTYLFGRELEQLGCPAAALGESIAALRLDPALADASVYQAGLLTSMDRHEQALAALGLALKSLEENPDRPFGVTRDDVVLAMGREQFRLGRYEEALASFRSLSHPEEHAWDMGLAVERLGRTDEAAKLFRRVVESGSNPTVVEEARRRLEAPPYAPPR